MSKNRSEVKLLLPFHTPDLLEVGCDEAGRGCLAGPVFAAAVVLPPDFAHPLLNDSKQMSHQDRISLRAVIEKESLAWSVAQVSSEEIDRINILNASFLAMHRALDALKLKPKHILVDGNRFHTYRKVKHTCVIQGDGIYASIAAASVLAKTYRDDWMEKLDAEHPAYAWKQNKGYPTLEHRKALMAFGPCIHHRRSFRLLPEATLFPLDELE